MRERLEFHYHYRPFINELIITSGEPRHCRCRHTFADKVPSGRCVATCHRRSSVHVWKQVWLPSVWACVTTRFLRDMVPAWPHCAEQKAQQPPGTADSADDDGDGRFYFGSKWVEFGESGGPVCWWEVQFKKIDASASLWLLTSIFGEI